MRNRVASTRTLAGGKKLPSKAHRVRPLYNILGTVLGTWSLSSA